MQEKRTEGAIIGAGIGGLSLAVALKKQGLILPVYEASPKLQAVGAGLLLAPNGLEALTRIDPQLKADVMNNSWPLTSFDLMTLNGTKMMRQQDPNHSMTCIHRARLQEILLRYLDPDQVITDKQLSKIQPETQGLELHFADHSQLKVAYLIGADGIHSQVRTEIFGSMPLRYAQQTCWRGICDLQLPPQWRSKGSEIWGELRGQRAGFAQINTDQIYYYLTMACEPGRPAKDLDQHKVLELFQDFPEPVPQMIQATHPEQFLCHELYDIAPLKTYFKERTVLVGDAAHATTPNMGQGANQALESALSLSRNLLQHREAPWQGFAQYQTERQTKAQWVTQQSWQLGQLSNLKYAWQRNCRNLILQNTPQSMSKRILKRLYQVV